MRNIVWLVVLVGALGSTARADQWMTPTPRTVISPNQKFQAVITPSPDGKSAATAAIGPKGGKGKVITLTTPWMPVDSLVFDDGTLLALDHWHSLGYGKVATLYERDGSVRWAKTLVELVGQPLADSAQHSVSSIWWRKMPLEWALAKDGKSGLITLFDENQVQLVLRDGGSQLVNVGKLPDDPARLLNRARALAAQPGQDAAAIVLLERVIAKDSDAFEAMLLYVEILQRTDDHAHVVALLDRVSPQWKTKDGYNLANVYGVWAKSLTALKRPGDAERVLRLAVIAAPEYTNPSIHLAELLFDQHRRKDADLVIDDFVARLLKASYLDSYALSAAAELYQKRKLLPKALALYLKGYKRDQVANQFLYANLAKLYEEMKHDAEAIRIHEQLLAYFKSQGSAFDSYAKATSDELARLRAKQRP
ncbi:MAG: tetratricopeptide repeat protein [Kofleriaceae bacterium]